jgi:1-acyl-sn-glycerol-3-phosphate acyltransferase
MLTLNGSSRNASKHHVEKALANGDRIGVAPGGIAEMFLGNSSSSNSSSDDEYAILNSRKGFIRLAIKHGIPVIPVYCFGGSQILSQVSLPSIIERISLFLRISICLFFGKFGLPIPFRQRLLYVVGKPIYPPRIKSDHNNDMESDVDEMHKQFCVSLTNIFNKYKDYYGWGDKRLQII